MNVKCFVDDINRQSLSNLIENIDLNSLGNHYTNDIFRKRIDQLNLKFYIETEKYINSKQDMQVCQEHLFKILFKQIHFYNIEIDRLNTLLKEKILESGKLETELSRLNKEIQSHVELKTLNKSLETKLKEKTDLEIKLRSEIEIFKKSQILNEKKQIEDNKKANNSFNKKGSNSEVNNININFNVQVKNMVNNNIIKDNKTSSSNSKQISPINKYKGTIKKTQTLPDSGAKNEISKYFKNIIINSIYSCQRYKFKKSFFYK
jgi:hypothetical protein